MPQWPFGGHKELLSELDTLVGTFFLMMHYDLTKPPALPLGYWGIFHGKKASGDSSQL